MYSKYSTDLFQRGWFNLENKNMMNLLEISKSSSSKHIVSCLSIMVHSTLSREGPIPVHDFKYLLMSIVKMGQAAVESAHNVVFQLSAITFQIPDHRFHFFRFAKCGVCALKFSTELFYLIIHFSLELLGLGCHMGAPLLPLKCPIL